MRYCFFGCTPKPPTEETRDMKVLIVAETAVLAMMMEARAECGLVFIVSAKEAGGLIWRSTANQTASLVDAVAEADFVIISHSDSDVVAWICELAGRKLLMGVFPESAVNPISSISLGMFQEMWPQIKEMAEFKIQQVNKGDGDAKIQEV